MEKRSESRLSYLFAHLHLLASRFFSSLIFILLDFSSLTLPTSAFPSLHIVGSLTSKLPSINHKQCTLELKRRVLLLKFRRSLVLLTRTGLGVQGDGRIVGNSHFHVIYTHQCLLTSMRFPIHHEMSLLYSHLSF